MAQLNWKKSLTGLFKPRSAVVGKPLSELVMNSGMSFSMRSVPVWTIDCTFTNLNALFFLFEFRKVSSVCFLLTRS